MKLQKKLDNLARNETTREETNPQTLWQNFKITLQKMAKETADKSRFQVESRLKNLEKDQKELADDINFDTDENLRTRESHLEHKIKHLRNIQARTN